MFGGLNKKDKGRREKNKNSVYWIYQKITKHQKLGTTHQNQWTLTLICIRSKLLQASFSQLTTTHNYIAKCKKNKTKLVFMQRL